MSSPSFSLLSSLQQKLEALLQGSTLAISKSSKELATANSQVRTCTFIHARRRARNSSQYERAMNLLDGPIGVLNNSAMHEHLSFVLHSRQCNKKSPPRQCKRRYEAK